MCTPCTRIVGGKSTVSSVSNSRYCALAARQSGESMIGGGAKYRNVTAVLLERSCMILLMLKHAPRMKQKTEINQNSRIGGKEVQQVFCRCDFVPLHIEFRTVDVLVGDASWIRFSIFGE